MVTKHAFMKAVLEGVSKGGKGAAKFFGQTAAKNIGTVTGDAARHAGGAAKWVAQNPGASLGIAGAGLGGYAMGKSGSSKKKDDEVDKAIEEIKGPKKVNEVLPEVSKDKRDDVLRELRQEKIGMQTTIGWK